MVGQLRRVDGRSAAAKRVKALTATFLADLGSKAPSAHMRDAAIRAAELTVLAEQARAEALRNGCSDPTALSRIEGCADRAVRRLGIPHHQQPDGMTLGDILKAGRHG
jgi:hypothetical protein